MSTKTDGMLQFPLQAWLDRKLMFRKVFHVACVRIAALCR